ncbi:MAG: flagellar hook-length control protein FliK [Chloroflexota bacterium]
MTVTQLDVVASSPALPMSGIPSGGGTAQAGFADLMAGLLLGAAEALPAGPSQTAGQPAQAADGIKVPTPGAQAMAPAEGQKGRKAEQGPDAGSPADEDLCKLAASIIAAALTPPQAAGDASTEPAGGGSLVAATSGQSSLSAQQAQTGTPEGTAQASGQEAVTPGAVPTDVPPAMKAEPVPDPVAVAPGERPNPPRAEAASPAPQAPETGEKRELPTAAAAKKGEDSSQPSAKPPLDERHVDRGRALGHVSAESGRVHGELVRDQARQQVERPAPPAHGPAKEGQPAQETPRAAEGSAKVTIPEADGQGQSTVKVGEVPDLSPRQVSPENVVSTSQPGQTAHRQDAVAQTERPAPGPETSQPKEQVVLMPRLQNEGGATEFKATLEPGSLGRLGVHIIQREGAVRVALAVERPEAMQLVEAQLPQLRHALEEQGIRLAGLDIGRGGLLGGLFTDGKRQRRQENGGDGKPAAVRTIDQVTGMTPRPTALAQASGARRLDVLI